MAQRAYRGRQPSASMDAEHLLEIVDTLEAAGVHVWLDGGWGVDALLGRETRAHDDLDLVAELHDADRIVELLEGLGYALVAGGAPMSFVLVDGSGRQVDVHPVTSSAEGGVYLMDDGEAWTYPAAGFAGRGTVAGESVRCLTPEVQVLVHAGYELSEKDYLELQLLHERFGVELPDHFVERVRAAGRQA